MKDLISVIIPCYNAAKTLPRTLNSIREQDYKNLEIIIVDDGSKDDSVEIATKFATIDDRIKVISQENSGVSVARNNGLANSHGEYIVFIDADDNYTTPYAYSKMMKRLKETDADMCICSFTHPCYEQYLPAGVYDLTDKSQFMKYYNDFFVLSMPWNKLRKRETITEGFVPGVRFGEDELFNLDNLHNVKRVVVMDEVLYNYYCTAYIPNDGASAITTAFKENGSIWFLFMKNQDYREKALRAFHSKDFEEMRYTRSFDFFFWSFFLMAKNRVSEDIIADNSKAVFNETLFMEALKSKEKYGLRLKNFTKQNIESFCKLAYYAFRDIKSYNKNLSMYQVFLMMFGEYFYEEGYNVNEDDILAHSMMSLKRNDTREAIYVNSILEIKRIQEETSKCGIVLFDNNMSSWVGTEIHWTGDGIKDK